MGDYTEHLITQAGGDGDEPIAAIEAHLKSMERAHRMSCSDPTDPERSTTYGESAKAIAYLLALVREQRKQLRFARDDAWKRGYDACKTGDQRHSPYRDAVEPKP